MEEEDQESDFAADWGAAEMQQQQQQQSGENVNKRRDGGSSSTVTAKSSEAVEVELEIGGDRRRQEETGGDRRRQEETGGDVRREAGGDGFAPADFHTDTNHPSSRQQSINAAWSRNCDILLNAAEPPLLILTQSLPHHPPAE
ncbi:hypothetical protein EX30DRAFT_349691 [Ascodesmis nigricans]|uniref:Uncharacterized protein n=1 Tax=Ascodesmis nigricans TaxID=341454 RepID=A0A4S2MUR1_9PEZI|nr:hypothetical protein EX30DRAFT_349691 [Ascodesmis nigricans]